MTSRSLNDALARKAECCGAGADDVGRPATEEEEDLTPEQTRQKLLEDALDAGLSAREEGARVPASKTDEKPSIADLRARTRRSLADTSRESGSR